MVLIILSLVSNVFGQVSDEQDKIGVIRETGSEVTQGKNTIEVAKGEDATAWLPMYSKTYMRIYENTKLDFYIVDPDTNAILIENSLVLKDVGEEGALVLLSTDNSEFKEILIKTGEEFKIEYQYSFMPFITLTPTITNSKDGSAVLFFLVPFLKTSQTDFSQVKPKSIDITKINTENTEQSKEEIVSSTNKNPKVIALIFGIVLLISVLVALRLRKKSKKSKRH